MKDFKVASSFDVREIDACFLAILGIAFAVFVCTVKECFQLKQIIIENGKDFIVKLVFLLKFCFLLFEFVLISNQFFFF